MRSMTGTNLTYLISNMKIVKDGIAVVTCKDGFRPVTFLLEATSEEAGPFYQNDK